MFFNTLILALSCAHAWASLAAASDEGDCALYLTGPGRSSAYDYSINLLKGNFGYDGQHTCITYDAINQAYLEARQRILVAQPKGDWKPEDYASVGELVLDISINIARRYGLTYEEIEKGLPLIDTSRTLIREVCPPVFSHVECRAGKYRRLDGLCNNLKHPTWGATNAPFQRLLSPLFSDGINAPRISHTGRDLPLSRVVSRTMHPDDGFHDHAGTVMVIAWGQFMDHDYTLTGTPLDPINRNDPEECCKRPPHLKHPYCNEIRIPDDDYFYRLFGVKCIDFVRGFPSPRPGCRLGSRVPFNTLTGAIDGNTVYGVTEKFARKLRTGFGGLLRMNPVFKEYGLKDLLPLKLDIPDEGCTRPNKNMYCFEAGEIRVNEQLVLTVMHTLMAREHNRVANGLAEVNPHWDDETLYQEARRINIAEIQHITYNEFLPILLGKDVMEKFGLVLEKEGYWEGYDDEVNPDVLASFASAAYRFGHSLLPTAIERWSKAHKFIASKRLSDLIRRPYDLYRAGVLDEYVMGLMNQVAQAMDDSITQEVTNHLFKKVGARFGMDLVSFNMQRGREFGIPGYMEFRKFCGLPGAETFQELFGSMTNQTVRKYETIFEHPIDVDLWSGGVSERPLPGSMLGPTFACIIATQFSYSRRGDRFWFELPNQPSSFTPEQLAEIRKSRMARVICDNTDIIDTVQLYPMVLPDHELNPRVPCRSGIIPTMDFSKWAEPAPFHNANAKEFITYALSSRNVTKSNATIEVEQNKNVKQTDNIVVQNSVSCNDCNKTHGTNTNEPVQCTNNKTTSLSCLNTTKHGSNTNDKTNDTINIKTDNTDTILKYVYNKNETNDEKSKGHYKNSLRKKRNIDSQKDQTAPLIVNYETLHSPGRDREEWLPAKHTANFVTGAELADFNIETLHDNVGNKDIKDNSDTHNDAREQNDSGELGNKDEDKQNSREFSDEKEEIKQRDSEEHTLKTSDEKELNSSHENSDEKERSDQTDDRSSESRERKLGDQKSRQINNFNSDDSKFRKPLGREIDDDDNINDKYTNDHSKSTKPFGREIEESDRQEDKYSNDHSKYVQPLGHKIRNNDDRHKNSYSNNTSKLTKPYREDQRDNEDDIHKNKYSDNPLKYTNSQRESDESSDSREQSVDENNTAQQSKENTRDTSSEEISRYKVPENINHNNNNHHHRNSSPLQIQDVDLDDFSYERIQLNTNGVVETARDVHENKDVEIIPSKVPKPFSKPHAESNYAPNESSESSSVEAVEPTHINDGEVKPVVEINSDANGSESDEDNSSLNNESLETLTGVKGDESDEKYDKLQKEPKAQDNGEIKQQFERIPLNYNHEQAKTKDSKDENFHNRDEINPVTPHARYDENLNIKFDDIAIKLPEIKLPDDILAYNHEEPPVYKANEKQKPKFYHYNSEEQKEPPSKKTTHDDDHDSDDDDDDDYDNTKDTGYHRTDDYDHDDNTDDHGHYYGKQSKEAYKKPKHDEVEDDDPYEKFVRERFGKRETFKKRSEKLRDLGVHNPELYKTVQTILEKTKNVKKEAEKSGDPNAGYMWTLEYGQKL